MRRISAYLVEGDLDVSPAPLAANAGRAFIGFFIHGAGFTFDDELARRGEASSTELMCKLLEKDPRNKDRIFPYTGGEEITSHPRQMTSRWVIDFEDYPLRRIPTERSWSQMSSGEQEECLRNGLVPLDYAAPVAADWPDLLAIVENLVRGERQKNKRESYKRKWWQFAEIRPSLRKSRQHVDRVVFHANLGGHLAFVTLDSSIVIGAPHNVFVGLSEFEIAQLQSRVHEIWARSFSSSLGDGIRYTPSRCFGAFPLMPVRT